MNTRTIKNIYIYKIKKTVISATCAVNMQKNVLLVYFFILTIHYYLNRNKSFLFLLNMFYTNIYSFLVAKILEFFLADCQHCFIKHKI